MVYADKLTMYVCQSIIEETVSIKYYLILLVRPLNPA